MNRNKLLTTFIFIFIIAVLSFLIDFPQLPTWVLGHNWFSKQKVHLGIDLQGGTQLIYQTDTINFPSDA